MMWCAVERPPVRCDAFGRKVRAGKNEAISVADHHVSEPVGQWSGTDEDEQPLSIDSVFFSGGSVTQCDSFEVVVTLGSDHLRARAHGDLRILFDLLNQVVGHRGFERVAANENGDGPSSAGEIDRSLACRIGAADYVHILLAAPCSFGDGRSVVNPSAGVGIESRRRKLAIGNTCRQDDRMSVDRRTVVETHCAGRAVDFQTGDVASGDDFGAELGCLAPRPIGQLCAGDSVGEAEVVLDPRTLAGLTACRPPFDENRPKPLRSAVQGSSQTRRAAADDNEIVKVFGESGTQPEFVGKFGVGGLDEDIPIGCDDDGKPQFVGTGSREQSLALRLVRHVPAIGKLVACQKFSDVG